MQEDYCGCKAGAEMQDGQRKKLNSKTVVTEASVGPTVSSGARAGRRVLLPSVLNWGEIARPL